VGGIVNNVYVIETTLKPDNLGTAQRSLH